ncbi:MAG: hypothetical protein FWD47_04060 [Treponema sp.]|nr:hypothetical protein [Treponema sp.]
MKHKRYFVLLAVFSLLFSNCFYLNLNTTLEIINNGKDSEVIIIGINFDEGADLFHSKYILESNKTLNLNKKEMKDIYFIFIRNETFEGIFETAVGVTRLFAKSNIIIQIENDEFELIAGDRVVWHNYFSYDDFDWSSKYENFEDFKAQEYDFIYEIIKSDLI